MLGTLLAILCAQDGEAPMKEAIAKLREAKSYRYEFKVHTEVPDSDPFDATGVGVMTGNVVSTEVKATGQLHRIIVASEKQALIWHPNLESWVDSVQYGEPDAGRGIQNANSLMKAIEGELATAKAGAAGEFTMELKGDAIKRVTQKLGLGIEGAVWGESALSTKIKVDAATGRIRGVTFECNIKIAPAAGGVASLKTTADVSITEYDGVKVIPDPTVEKKKVPIAEALKDLGLDPAKFK